MSKPDFACNVKTYTFHGATVRDCLKKAAGFKVFDEVICGMANQLGPASFSFEPSHTTDPETKKAGEYSLTISMPWPED